MNKCRHYSEEPVISGRSGDLLGSFEKQLLVVFPCRFKIVQNVSFIAVVAPLPTAHFPAAGPHCKAIGTGRRRAQIGPSRSKRFGDARPGMGPALDQARVSTAIGLIKDLDGE